MENKIVDGIGGGICQVSTTLYNAVLLSNLEVILRLTHSMTVNYIPWVKTQQLNMGLWILNLKTIKNPIIIKSEVNNGKITLKFLERRKKTTKKL